MTLGSIYWIASCTKMLTELSCIHLVEKGQLSLDDSDLLEKLCPELRDVQVLKEQGALEPKRNRITLRCCYRIRPDLATPFSTNASVTMDTLPASMNFPAACKTCRRL